jgi:hypothetical protein
VCRFFCRGDFSRQIADIKIPSYSVYAQANKFAPTRRIIRMVCRAFCRGDFSRPIAF